MITEEIKNKILNSYEGNKDDLKIIEKIINKDGCTDDGIYDVNISFEQGYNNALEMVMNLLKIKYTK